MRSGEGDAEYDPTDCLGGTRAEGDCCFLPSSTKKNRAVRNAVYDVRVFAALGSGGLQRVGDNGRGTDGACLRSKVLPTGIRMGSWAMFKNPNTSYRMLQFGFAPHERLTSDVCCQALRFACHCVMVRELGWTDRVKRLAWQHAWARTWTLHEVHHRVQVCRQAVGIRPSFRDRQWKREMRKHQVLILLAAGSDPDTTSCCSNSSYAYGPNRMGGHGHRRPFAHTSAWTLYCA